MGAGRGWRGVRLPAGRCGLAACAGRAGAGGRVGNERRPGDVRLLWQQRLPVDHLPDQQRVRPPRSGQRGGGRHGSRRADPGGGVRLLRALPARGPGGRRQHGAPVPLAARAGGPALELEQPAAPDHHRRAHLFRRADLRLLDGGDQRHPGPPFHGHLRHGALCHGGAFDHRHGGDPGCPGAGALSQDGPGLRGRAGHPPSGADLDQADAGNLCRTRRGGRRWLVPCRTRRAVRGSPVRRSGACHPVGTPAPAGELLPAAGVHLQRGSQAGHVPRRPRLRDRHVRPRPADAPARRLGPDGLPQGDVRRARGVHGRELPAHRPPPAQRRGS